MAVRLCMNCMKNIDASIGGGEVCPHCGWNNNTPQLKSALQYSSILQNRYITGRVKSANSEGFTYAAFDKIDSELVDVREFFPSTLCYRDGDEMFAAEGKNPPVSNLLGEFSILAANLIKIRDLAGMMPVKDVFYQNNTAYIVYIHFDSITLRKFIEQGVLDWNTAKKLFAPLLSSLSSMHNFDVKHLAISPDTIRVCKDGKLRLSEFCIESARRNGSPIEPEIFSGYGAYEQYTETLECEEITDVYGFASTILFALSGDSPGDARKRINDQRLLISKDILKQLPQNVVTALAGALQVKQEERIGSFERLRAQILSEQKVNVATEETASLKTLPKTYQNIPQDRSLPPKFWLIGSFILTAFIITGVFYYIFNHTDFSTKKLVDDFMSANETSALEVVTVPSFVGDSYNDWVEKLKDTSLYRFTIKVASQEFSEDVPEGYIISQDPQGGQTVEKNGEISIVVSRGSTQRTLPAINGTKFTSALEALEAEGFEVVREDVYDNKTAAGNVIWYRDYNSGDELPYGTSVVVVVSLGPAPGN